MKHIVTNLKEVKDMLTYFGGFHDAYIRTLTIRSHYETLPEKAENLLPGFDVIICFAHHAYAEYNPYTRIVTVEFPDAKAFRLDLPDIQSGEFIIYDSDVTEAEDGFLQYSLTIQVADGNRFKHEKLNLLKFRRAIFTEG